jgi:hypothetical protein
MDTHPRSVGERVALGDVENDVRLLTFLLLLPLAFAEDELARVYPGNPTLRQGQCALWNDPGEVETLDFRYGIGGPEAAPKPPFTFVDEDDSGSTAKVKVRDANGRDWVLKFGHEASPEVFGTRLAWAAGYYVEPSYFVPEGTIERVKKLTRARKDVDDKGHFDAARFQLRFKEPRFLKYATWSWDENPFLGTPELGGLKVLMMLLSNWDNKDGRDAESRGTNTAVFQSGNLLLFFIDDWGASMGRWGKYFTRSKWDAKSFLDQSPQFVRFENGELRWGYVGQHSSLLTKDIRPGDIAWLMQYLGRVTDDQLRAGLLASGASDEETAVYLQALRMRIGELQAVVK